MALFPFVAQTSRAADGLSNSDWIAIASAVVSILALLATIYFSRRAETASKSANDVATGQAETQLRGAISASRQRMDECSLQIATLLGDRKPTELSARENAIYKAQLGIYDRAAEQLLNSYEDACAKYLDRKIDVTRFKKAYVTEIRNLCEKETGTIHRLLHPNVTSNYKAVWTVYEKWNNLEANR